MRKGRHRRHRDARDLKRGVLVNAKPSTPPEPCDECQRWPHAEWCRAEEFATDEE